MFEPIPFAFSGDFRGWVAWKSLLATLIDVDPHDIVMTGSAALGFSLNPSNGFSAFHAASDLDCGVVSGYYFDVAWRYLRQQRVSWLTLPRPLKSAIELHRKNYIFSGTIAADRMLGLLPFGRAWQSALDRMASERLTKGREVNLRIYKDFDALRHYQAHGVKLIRARISSDLQTSEIEEISSDLEIGEENEATR